jgi:hypothetical protein
MEPMPTLKNFLGIRGISLFIMLAAFYCCKAYTKDEKDTIPMQPKIKLPAIEIDSVFFASAEEISISVVIRNDWKEPIEFYTISKKPPVRFLVLDEKGNPLSSDSADEGPKKRNTKNVKYTLAAGEADKGTVTIRLAKLKQERPKAKTNWSVVGTLPIVRYDSGQYKVDLVKSKKYDFEAIRKDIPK